MPRAVRLLQSALDTVGDRHALSLLRPPQHLKESFLSNQIIPTNKKKMNIDHAHKSFNKKGSNVGFHNDHDFQVVDVRKSPGSDDSIFPSINRRKRFIPASTVIIFNLALCYHFGRGIEQVCLCAHCFTCISLLIF